MTKKELHKFKSLEEAIEAVRKNVEPVSIWLVSAQSVKEDAIHYIEQNRIDCAIALLNVIECGCEWCTSDGENLNPVLEISDLEIMLTFE